MNIKKVNGSLIYLFGNLAVAALYTLLEFLFLTPTDLRPRGHNNQLEFSALLKLDYDGRSNSLD